MARLTLYGKSSFSSSGRLIAIRNSKKTGEVTVWSRTDATPEKGLVNGDAIHDELYTTTSPLPSFEKDSLYAENYNRRKH